MLFYQILDELKIYVLVFCQCVILIVIDV